jgi:hypothetical protein
MYFSVDNQNDGMSGISWIYPTVDSNMFSSETLYSTETLTFKESDVEEYCTFDKCVLTAGVYCASNSDCSYSIVYTHEDSMKELIEGVSQDATIEKAYDSMMFYFYVGKEVDKVMLKFHEHTGDSYRIYVNKGGFVDVTQDWTWEFSLKSGYRTYVLEQARLGPNQSMTG